MLRSFLKRMKKLFRTREPNDYGFDARHRADRPRDPIEMAALYGMLR